MKFKWQGRIIQRSTHSKNKRAAQQIENRLRSELALGNWGILERKQPPALGEFLRSDFLPYVETTFKDGKPATLRYYRQSVDRLRGSTYLSERHLDQITDKQAKEFAARNARLSPSTINAALRTLRRALNLAEEWGVLDRSPKIRLAKGEKQRERVLSEAEVKKYLEKCRQPWKDAATIILGTGMRPGEVFILRWENVRFSESRGWIRIVEGKSKAARRELPMVPAVLEAMQGRFAEQGNPTEGFVFPADTESGHTERDSLKRSHRGALKASKVGSFPPYTLRHTALTNLATSGCDAFTLATIAGHSSITITQRYCHPQADAIERAMLGVVTAGGDTQGNGEEEEDQGIEE